MQRLVVVSNRVALPRERSAPARMAVEHTPSQS